LLIINAVGLTPRLLAFAPRLAELARRGWCLPFKEVVPAVTCTAQASLLTGQIPAVHGIVGNGWLFKDTREVRFWQQSNRLLQAEPLYATAKRRADAQDRPFRVAKLFWWFNQGAQVDISVTPKPHYSVDGRKAFDILTTPPEFAKTLTQKLGRFPFPAFWGPMAGLASTQWIAEATALTIKEERPHLTLTYLPHLDYDLQRFGPSGCDVQRRVAELDRACEPLLDAAKALGARVWVVSEYGHTDVTTPIYVNCVLREAGLLSVRPGPFGEQLDLFASRAFAVCDHQLAHIYVRDKDDIERVAELLAELPYVDRMLIAAQRTKVGLDHPRSGEIVLLAKPQAWFAYPFWLDERHAPDYARTVAIHHKPGYDPCELCMDPRLIWPKGRLMRKRLLQSLGFRAIYDVVPLDAALIRGSHGVPAATDSDRPLWIGDLIAPGVGHVPMTLFRDHALAAMDLAEEVEPAVT
jgi:predicted AlkP superfamily pyrophosphatase or phosphodiesterase